MSRLVLDNLSGSSGALTRPTGSNQMSIQIIRLAIWLALDNINFFIQTIRLEPVPLSKSSSSFTRPVTGCRLLHQMSRLALWLGLDYTG